MRRNQEIVQDLIIIFIHIIFTLLELQTMIPNLQVFLDKNLYLWSKVQEETGEEQNARAH